MEIIIEKTKNSVTTNVINIVGTNSISKPVTFYILGSIGTDEHIYFQYYDGSNWRTIVENGNNRTLSSNNNVLSLYSPLEFRLLKETTSNPVGVGISHIISIT